MSKCNKVKNPCKICLGPVSQKTGLQCKGACDSWVHYSCLNYTPGRIRDIKKGIIKVTCPCPDCKTTTPKEYRTDEPFSCTNVQCPANRPPQCGNPVCPTNKGEKMNQTSGYQGYALNKCGVNECKQRSTPNVSTMMPPSQPKGVSPVNSSSDPCIFNRCQSGGCVSANVSGDMRSNMEMPSMYTMQEMCNTIAVLTKQINEIMNRMQPHSGRSPCPQKGPKALCPKPCYCPENPAYKR